MPSPDSRATSSMGRSRDSRSSRARSTRRLRIHAPGDCPVSSRNRRLKVRALILACRASRCTVSSSSRCRSAHSRVRRRRVVIRCRHLPIDELRLTALTPRRHHAVPGNGVGHLRAVVTSNDVQAQVDSGRESRRSQYVAVIDEQHVLVDQHLGVQPAHGVGELPVRGRGSSVEQPGGCEHERTGADRHQPGARPDQRQRGGGLLRQHAVDAGGWVPRARDHHGVGGRQAPPDRRSAGRRNPVVASIGPRVSPHVTTS